MMEGTQKIVEMLTTLSGIAGSVVTIIGLLSVIFKPIRNGVLWFIHRVYGSRKNEMLEEIKGVRTELCTKMDEMREDIRAVSNKVDENERERLRTDIFSFGNKARRGEAIDGEEFRRLQEVFQKYEDLGGNGRTHEEYNFVVNYYNESGWTKHKEEQ